MADAQIMPHKSPTPPWLAEFEYKDHPPGFAGILASLEAVRQGILRGKVHPRVGEWVDRVLIAAGNPRGHIGRAEAIHEGMRRQNFWKPDPRGVELVAEAHLVLGDGQSQPPRAGADCDELTAALGAACEHAGIPTCVVGAAYDDGKNISHVLLMVSDGKGNWYYADPSADWDFGQAKPATREYVIDTQTGKVLCDGTSCSVPLQGKLPPDEGPGKFLRLGADPHTFAPVGAVSGHEPVAVNRLGAEVKPLGPQELEAIADVQETVLRYWKASKALYDASQSALADLGLPLLGTPENKLFGPADAQRFLDLYGMSRFSLDVLQEARDGKRNIGITEGGDIVIERLPTDTMYLGFDGAQPQLFSVSSNKVIHTSGTLGIWPWIVAAVVAVAFSGAAAVASDSWSKAKQAESAAAREIAKLEADLIKAGKTEELVRVYNARKNLLAVEQQNGVGAQVATAVDSLTRAFELFGKGALVVLALWGAKKGVDYAKQKRWIG
jgi:hypothetical protein